MWLTCQTKNGHFLDPQGNGRWEVACHLHEELLIVPNIAALCVWVVCVGGVCGWCVWVVCVSVSSRCVTCVQRQSDIDTLNHHRPVPRLFQGGEVTQLRSHS